MIIDNLNNLYVKTKADMSINGTSNENLINNYTLVASIEKERFTNIYDSIKIVVRVDAMTYKQFETSHIYITTLFNPSSYEPYVVMTKETSLFDIYYKLDGENLLIYVKINKTNTKVNFTTIEGDSYYIKYENQYDAYNIENIDGLQQAILNVDSGKLFDLKNNLINCSPSSYLKCKLNGSVGYQGVIQLNTPSSEVVAVANIQNDILIPKWVTHNNTQINLAKDTNNNYGFIPVFIDPTDKKIKAYCNVKGTLGNISEIWVNLNYTI